VFPKRLLEGWLKDGSQNNRGYVKHPEIRMCDRHYAWSYVVYDVGGVYVV